MEDRPADPHTHFVVSFPYRSLYAQGWQGAWPWRGAFPRRSLPRGAPPARSRLKRLLGIPPSARRRSPLMRGDRRGLLPPSLAEARGSLTLPALLSAPHTHTCAPSKALSWRAKGGREPRNPAARLPSGHTRAEGVGSPWGGRKIIRKKEKKEKKSGKKPPVQGQDFLP